MINALILSIALLMQSTAPPASPAPVSPQQTTYNQAQATHGADHPATLEALRTWIASVPPGSGQARSLSYQLAAAYYRQLRYAEAEALIAPFLEAPNYPSGYREQQRRKDAVISAVRKGDLPEALALVQAEISSIEAIFVKGKDAIAALENKLAAAEPGPAAIAATETVRKANANVRSVGVGLAVLHGQAGEVQHALGHLAQAEKAYATALALFAEYPGFDVRIPQRIATAMAILLHSKGEHAAALPLLQKAQATLLPFNGPDHPDVIELEHELAFVHLAMKNHAEALPLFQRKLKRAELDPANAGAIVESLDALAKLALAEGDFGGAESSLLRILAMLESAPSRNKAGIDSVLLRLKQVYDAGGETGKAQAIAKRLSAPLPKPGKKGSAAKKKG